MNINQSLSILNNIPQYIINEYPLFVDFVKAYYEYMDQTGKTNDLIQNVIMYSDIDETIDGFLNYFKNDLMKDVPSQFACNERLLLKHIKELYTSKGSEASYRLLFRALYNKEIEFYSPINNILRPSEGKWHQDYSIMVRIPKTYSLDNINSAYNNEIKIAYNGQNLYATVTLIKQVSSDSTYYYSEFFLLRDFVTIEKIKQLPANISNLNIDVTYGTTFSGVLLPTLSSNTIMKSGANIRSGVVYDIDNTQGINGKLLIKQVNSGAIIDSEIINFGHGYYNTFQQILNPQNVTFATASVVVTDGVITAINLIDGGSGYTTAPIIEIIGDGIGAKAHCTISGGSVDNIILDYGGKSYTYTPTAIFDQSSAVIRFNIGSIRKYPGFYTASDSLISDDSYIQDGYYYQSYSYIIDADVLFAKYKNILKNLLHPSGYKLFGAVSKVDKKDLITVGVYVPAQTGIYPLDSVFIYDSVYWLFQPEPIPDYVSLLDSESHVVYNLTKILPSDTIDFTDMDVIDVSRTLLLVDTNLTTVDTNGVSKNYSSFLPSDSFTLGESVLIPPFISLVVNDGIRAFGTGINDTYGTTFNTDYFVEDFMEEPLVIV